MGGTLTVQLGVMLPVSVRLGLLREGRVGTGRGGAVGWCTLLGPEGPGFLPQVVSVRVLLVGGGWAVRVLRWAA
jgi:hypothetical protein